MTNASGEGSLVRSSQHLLGLDGLRGIAAIAVLWLHTDQIFQLNMMTGSTYLAVDFFFMLSGFVLARAYENRLNDGSLTWVELARLRLIRLMPLLILGELLGAPVFILSMVHKHQGSISELASVCLGNLFLVPAGLWFALEPYPTDNPVWSLFFELLANAIHASSLRRVTGWAGAVMIAVSGLVLSGAVLHYGNLDHLGLGSWASFSAGLLRVAFPYMIGVALWRTGSSKRVPTAPFWLSALALGGTLLFNVDMMRQAYDLVAVGLIFPVIIVTAANARIGSKGTTACLILGSASYPLYVLHTPLLRASNFLAAAHNFFGEKLLIVAMTISACAFVSWVALVYYDQPARAKLR